MRPRQVSQIPKVAPPDAFHGAIIGSVFQENTGFGIDSAAIQLTPVGRELNRTPRSFVTDPSGGFRFDGVAPGSYWIRILAMWHHPDSVLRVVTAGKVDTVAVPMERPGFCGR